MCSRLLKRVRKTVVFRLSLWYCLLFVLSCLFVFAFAYLLLSTTLKRQDQHAIRTWAKELSVLYEAGGQEALERGITRGRKFDGRDPLFVRLADPDNRTRLLLLPYQWLAFDIKLLERQNAEPDPTWLRLPLGQSEHTLELGSFSLPEGYRLQVGKSSEERDRILRRFRGLFAAVMIPVLLLGVAGGAFLSLRALSPVRDLIRTVRSIDSGQLDARVPSPQTEDELDELVRLFNGMLGKIEALINGMRETLDNVAHDVRTPMARLRATAETALRSDCGREALREALADCMEESEAVLTMLNTLMDISEAETGAVQPCLQRTDVSRLADQVAALYHYVAEEKGIEIRTHYEQDLFATVDPARMKQAVANLVDNAVKYTKPGGTVRLSTHRRAMEAIITVQDDGPGITQDALPRIWERLYRGDDSRSQRGLGLGLSLVKAIVEAHKGTSEVVSEPGKGSTFTLRLPATEEAAPIPNLSRL